MPEMHLKQPGFTYGTYGLYLLAVHLLKINKEFKSLWRQEIQNTFTEMNETGLVFNMIWSMEIFKT